MATYIVGLLCIYSYDTIFNSFDDKHREAFLTTLF